MVESIPEGLIYPNLTYISTFKAWDTLINMANVSIDIISFYWTLRGKDINVTHTSAWEGEHIFNSLLNASKKRNINIRIVQSKSNDSSVNLDTLELMEKKAALVRYVDIPILLGGVLHSKAIIIDNKHFYVGR